MDVMLTQLQQHKFNAQQQEDMLVNSQHKFKFQELVILLKAQLVLLTLPSHYYLIVFHQTKVQHKEVLYLLLLAKISAQISHKIKFLLD